MQLLREVVKDDSRRLQDLPLLNSDDERILLGDWNNTDVTHDRNRCVHRLFESTVHRTPDGRAVIVGDESFSYRHIDERANRLAHLLLQRKVVVGDRVAICLDRCVDMPIAMAAVLKAGAAYVPLDPTHPSERLRYTLDDAKTACVITHRRFATLFAETETLVLLDDGPILMSLRRHRPISRSDPKIWPTSYIRPDRPVGRKGYRSSTATL